MKNLLLILCSTAALQACNSHAITSPPPGPPPTVPSAERPAVDHSKVSTQLKAAQSKWQQTRPASYQYTYQRTCFCPVEYTRPLNVTVRGNKVQKVTAIPGDPPMPPNRKNDGQTIEQLFGIIDKAIAANTSSIQAKFDQQYGYPTQITIDHDFMMADEETYITANNLKRVQ